MFNDLNDCRSLAMILDLVRVQAKPGRLVVPRGSRRDCSRGSFFRPETPAHGGAFPGNVAAVKSNSKVRAEFCRQRASWILSLSFFSQSLARCLFERHAQNCFTITQDITTTQRSTSHGTKHRAKRTESTESTERALKQISSQAFLWWQAKCFRQGGHFSSHTA